MIALPKPKNASPLGHSADIDLRLHVDGQVIALAQTGRDEIKLAGEMDVPPGPAEVEIITDGVSYRSQVTIVGPQQQDRRWLIINR
jgi:hypothetical protein